MRNRVLKEVQKRLSHQIKADKDNVPILFRISCYLKTSKEGKTILEDSGINIVEKKHLSSNEIPIRLDERDMRRVALKPKWLKASELNDFALLTDNFKFTISPSIIWNELSGDSLVNDEIRRNNGRFF